jgi:hypothetical protein
MNVHQQRARAIALSLPKIEGVAGMRPIRDIFMVGIGSNSASAPGNKPIPKLKITSMEFIIFCSWVSR